MIKRGIINEELNIDSHLRRENGSCPLLPEEVCPQSTILVPDHVIILVSVSMKMKRNALFFVPLETSLFLLWLI